MRLTLSLSVVGLMLSTAGSASAQAVLSLLNTVDISSTANSANSQFIGSNPSAVAWNGSTLWVGGYNASGVAATTAITRVELGSPVGSPVFNPAFGSLSTNNTRGITSLAVQGNTLAASWDNGGGSGDSVRSFNATTGALNWRIGDPSPAANDSSRRGNGVAFDPGFNAGGSNQGIAYLTQTNSGRRHLLDTATGGYINGQNAGAIINFSDNLTVWRDLAFDPATGDLYTREANRIGKAVRNGDNSFVGASSTAIGGLTRVATVDNENIAFLTPSAAGLPSKLLAVNDRQVTSSGQLATNVIKLFDTSGNAVGYTITDQFGNPVTLANGNGAYDFSWDNATQTLAVSDFANRSVYIFGVNTVPVPEPATVLAVATAGLGAVGWVRRRRAAQPVA